MDTSEKPVVVENGQEHAALINTSSVMEYLAQKKEGIYTTARTVEKNSILEWNIHVQRMAMLKGWKQQGDEKGEERGRNEPELLAYVSDRILPSVQLAMRIFKERYPTHDGEMKIVVHVTLTNEEHLATDPRFHPINVFVQVQPLPAPPKWPAIVQIRKAGPRSNATVKSVEWVSARKVFEEQMTKDVNEAILADSHGYLFEGLSSNFFVVLSTNDKSSSSSATSDYLIQTAPDEAVLGGSIRSLVLQACKKHSVPVEMKTPSLGDLSHWKAAFVTSTSRLVLAVGTVRLLDEEGAPEVLLGEIPPLLTDLSRWVLEELKENSTLILKD